jgi:alpha-tubulin suppressor-like RCC1 family protein
MRKLIIPLIVLVLSSACGSVDDFTTSFSENAFGDVADIAAGHYHSVAVKSDGTVWAWGSNENGQLGTGDGEDSFVPRQVESLSNIVAVAAGARHSLALDEEGNVWSWGSNSSTPVQIGEVSDVIAIDAGWAHSIALLYDGTLWAWGKNGYGQLGDGNEGDSEVPVKVTGLTDVVSIAAGSEHNVALVSDGTVWTWGRNSAGQLGTGDTDWASNSIPEMVEGLSNIAAVAAGWGHTAVLTEEGAVLMWGNNESGQLGDGTSTDNYTPAQVSGLPVIRSIVSGYDHMLAVDSEGKLWGWGSNYLGQAGAGVIATAVNTPMPAENIAETSIASGGLRHSLAVDSAGNLWSWGSGRKGQLGDGTTDSYASPIPIENP